MSIATKLNAVRSTKKLLDGFCPGCMLAFVNIVKRTPDKKRAAKKCMMVVCDDCKKKMGNYARDVGLVK